MKTKQSTARLFVMISLLVISVLPFISMVTEYSNSGIASRSAIPASTPMSSSGTPTGIFPLGILGPSSDNAHRQGIMQTLATLSTSSPSSVSVATGIDGLNEKQSGNWVPPDVGIAVGPNNVMETVNLERAIYNRTTLSLIRTESLPKFFGTGADFLSDPKILYDNSSNRWFASIIDLNGLNPITRSNVLIAISSTADAIGKWTVYHTISLGPNILPDQPIIGINDDKFVVSFNKFNYTSSAYLGAQWFVFNKSDLVSGAASPRFTSFGPDPTLASVHPVQSLSSTTTLYMISSGAVTSSASPASTNTMKLFSVTGVPGVSTVTSSQTSLTVQTISQPPLGQEPSPPPGPNPGNQINTDDYRVLDAAWYRGKMWLSLDDDCKPDGVTDQACVRLIQIDTGTTTVKQDFDYGAKYMDFFYPALRIDSMGNLDLIYGFSSAGTYPSLAVTGQAVNDPANSLASPSTIKSGTAVDVSGRYGDYFGVALDPTNPTISWVAGEYDNSAIGNCSLYTPCWSTFITEMRERQVVSISSVSTFTGVTIKTTGSLSLDAPLTGTLKVSGTATVLATNSTTGATLFSKTYTITSLALTNSSGREPYQVLFLLNVAVNPYPLSSDITIGFIGTSINASVGVTRNLDIDLNGSVDQTDLSIAQAAFGCSIGKACYNPRADVDADGTVDVIDIATIGSYYGAADFI